MDTYKYTYDSAHNQLTKDETINGVYKGITSYTYDVLNRLETVSEPNQRKTVYTFDASGNRKTETITEAQNTTVNIYSYDGQNRLTGITTTLNGTNTQTTTYEYDNNGNQTKTLINGEVTVTNVYDKLNQLIKTISEGTTVENEYNGEGYRVEKSVNGTLTRYLYEYDKVVLEVDDNGNQTGRNIYGTNLLMRSTGGQSYYYMYNGHADVTALINVTTGHVDATYYYDAFGNIIESTGDVNNNITYAGYQYDKETGLYYLNARMYDPKIARFVQEDTYKGSAADPLSLNLYTYCLNNPLIYWDPTGHYAENGSDDYIRDYYWNEYSLLVKYSQDWNNAKTDEQRNIAHINAEKVRDNIESKDKEYSEFRTKGIDDNDRYKSTNELSPDNIQLEEYMATKYTGQSTITVLVEQPIHGSNDPYDSLSEAGYGHVFVRVEHYEENNGKTKKVVEYTGFNPGSVELNTVTWGSKGVLDDQPDHEWNIGKVYNYSKDRYSDIEKVYDKYENSNYSIWNNCGDFVKEVYNSAGLEDSNSPFKYNILTDAKYDLYNLIGLNDLIITPPRVGGSIWYMGGYIRHVDDTFPGAVTDEEFTPPVPKVGPEPKSIVSPTPTP